MTDAYDRLKTALADRYEIERELGAGGMATVYLAHDQKHDRKVAIKVMRPELSAILGGERFLREVSIAAKLNHPHILALYDSGQAEEFLYYVMPHVEGESLRDKLNREKQLAVDDAISITKQVGAALDYAHDQEVIHRDIKPENILIHQSEALVADFGIALAVTAAGGTRITDTGLSLGTPEYMSPEQATGERELDARSDVYSLGAITYEMLVGEPPHTGNTVQAIIAKVVSAEPQPVSRVRHTVPSNVDAAVMCALAKTPADRFGSGAELAGALANPAYALPDTVPRTAVGIGTEGIWSRVNLGLAGALVITVIVALWGWLRSEPAGPVSRYAITFPPGQELTGEFDIAPDGSWIVYVGPGVGEDETQLWVKPRDSYLATPLAGTGRARGPSVSTEGRWIAYSVGGQIRKIPVGGGPWLTVADSARQELGPSVAWLDDGSMVFAGNHGQLYRVPATDGTAEVVLAPEPGSSAFGPRPLPGSRGVSFLMLEPNAEPTFSSWVLDLRNGESHKLLDRGFAGGYLPTGHLLTVHIPLDGSDPNMGVFAIEFDLERLTTSGEQIPLLETTGGLAYSASGTLIVEVAGEFILLEQEVVWVDRDGAVEPVDTSWSVHSQADYAHGLSLSPDGTRLAIGLIGDDGGDVWVKELNDGPIFPLVSGGGNDMRPVWTQNGQKVAFLKGHLGSPYGWDLYEKRADGIGDVEFLLSTPDGAITEFVFTPTRDWILIRSGGTGGRLGGRDILGYRPGVDSSAIPLMTEEHDETAMSLSPDGNWLAYTTSESGRYEVVVRRFPDLELGRHPVSVSGGTSPLWAHNGRELFYLNADNEMVVASVVTMPEFRVIDRQVLFQLGPEFPRDMQFTSYDISPDDSRFIMIRNLGSQANAPPLFLLVENWFEEVRTLMEQRND